MLKGLRARVILIQGFVIAVALNLMGIILYQVQKTALIEQFVDQAQLTSSIMKARMEIENTNKLFSDNISMVKPISPLFSSILLIPSNDKTKIANLIHNFPPSFSNRLAEVLHGCKPDFVNMMNMRLLYISPVYNSNGNCGNLVIVSSKTFLTKKLFLIIEVLSAYIFLNFFILTIVAWFIIDRYTVIPLRKLEQAVQGVSNGDYPQIKQMPNASEFHEIAKAFNTMSSTIQSKEQSLKNTIKELKETQELIIKKERLATIGTFSSGISHEIGNPLSAIISMLETLRSQMTLNKNDTIPSSSKVTDIQLDMINRSLNEAYRIDALIKQLLLYVRQKPAILNNVNINSLINDVITSVKSIRELEGINTVLHVKPDIVFRTDYEKLRQVLLNLITNAVDAMNHKGVLTVTADVKGKQLVLEVSDTGEGIDNKTMEKIFEPFFTTKTAGKGTGLGLAIVKNLVQDLNGEISVESKKGVGTTFKVKLS